MPVKIKKSSSIKSSVFSKLNFEQKFHASLRISSNSFSKPGHICIWGAVNKFSGIKVRKKINPRKRKT